MKKIFAVSSGGGHWEQLMAISPAFSGHDVYYANTLKGLSEKSGIKSDRAYLLTDCNRSSIISLLKCLIDITNVLIKVKPDIIITTGAAPGIMSLAVGRIFGSHLIWIDSVANTEKLSLSGKIATYIAHKRLTQWQHLADEKRVHYMGSVL